VTTLTRSHAAFKTGSQIDLTDRSQGINDLSLGGVCNFHFMACRHAGIYVARGSEPGFFGELWVVEVMMVVPQRSWASWWPVAGTLEPRCIRALDRTSVSRQAGSIADAVIARGIVMVHRSALSRLAAMSVGGSRGPRTGLRGHFTNGCFLRPSCPRHEWRRG
jgi:hypothetical protein